MILPKFQQNGKIDFDFDSKHFWYSFFLFLFCYYDIIVIVDTRTRTMKRRNANTNEKSAGDGTQRISRLFIYLFWFCYYFVCGKCGVEKLANFSLSSICTLNLQSSKRRNYSFIFICYTHSHTHTHKFAQQNNISIREPVRIMCCTELNCESNAFRSFRLYSLHSMKRKFFLRSPFFMWISIDLILTLLSHLIRRAA